MLSYLCFLTRFLSKGLVRVLAETYFKKIFKGYDPAQVDAFIISLSDKYEECEKDFAEQKRALEIENEKLRGKIQELEAQLEEAAKEHEQALIEKQKEYDALCAQIGERMIRADQRADDIIKTAETEASDLVEQARQASEYEARTTRKQAEEEAAKIIDATRKKCDSLSAAAEEFRMRQYEMSKSMSETEKRFESALDKLRADISEQE